MSCATQNAPEQLGAARCSTSAAKEEQMGWGAVVLPGVALTPSNPEQGWGSSTEGRTSPCLSVSPKGAG